MWHGLKKVSPELARLLRSSWQRNNDVSSSLHKLIGIGEVKQSSAAAGRVPRCYAFVELGIGMHFFTAGSAIDYVVSVVGWGEDTSQGQYWIVREFVRREQDSPVFLARAGGDQCCVVKVLGGVSNVACVQPAHACRAARNVL